MLMIWEKESLGFRIGLILGWSGMKNRIEFSLIKYKVSGSDFFPKKRKVGPKSQKPFGVELVFTTENIEKDFQSAINFGATEFEPITEKPWGQKVGYLRDNNGFLIEICTPMKTE
mgnify:CR=1 FL=1